MPFGNYLFTSVFTNCLNHVMYRNIMLQKVPNLQTKTPPQNSNVAKDSDKGLLFWHAFDLLEVLACSFNDDGDLHFLNNGASNIFLLDNPPKNLYDLAEILCLPSFAMHIMACNMGAKGKQNEVFITRSENGQIEIRVNHKTRMITLQKLGAKPSTDLPEDAQTQALKKALKAGRLTLFRQPIVSSVNGKIVRFECLARMVNEDGSIANAADFIPAAERAGLIAELDLAALSLALKSLKNRRDLQLAVNVSAATIADTNARQEFESLLKHSKDEARFLTVEITETIAIQDLDVAAKFAAKVRVNNARVALDDFGVGHTSFRSLKAIPLDEVKIDGHYVEKINERGDSRAFVKAIDSLSRELGLETVAERVETEHEAAILREIGVFALQGYLFGKPSAA